MTKEKALQCCEEIQVSNESEDLVEFAEYVKELISENESYKISLNQSDNKINEIQQTAQALSSDITILKEAVVRMACNIFK